jgi:hypothetical protein
LMLEELGCDRHTYGDVIDGTKDIRYMHLDSKIKHIWSLTSELKSFKHALKIINND